MRLGFLRRKNTDLPLFNGRRNGSRSPSPQRKVISRKYICLGIFVLILLILLLKPSGSSQSKRRTPKNRFDRYFNAREDLFNNRLFFIKSVAGVCTNFDKNSTYWPQSADRYTPLGQDENAGIEHNYFIALMLRNSANHLPTIVDNLLRVIYHVGEKNVFMSIYEGGSTDEGHTSAMIETIRTTMDVIGIEYHIEIEGEDTTSVRRNAVLEPLREMYRNGGRVFNTVVMMGDDLWCTEEVFELLYVSRGQRASIVCSTDVHSEGTKFSISPGHDVNGRLFLEGHISDYIPDDFTSRRFKDNYPLRVQSCFSSITVLDPTPLYTPYDFTFSLPNQSQSHERVAELVRECGFSPELDMALRYAASGFNHQILVPRTQTANNLLDFFKTHRTQTELAEREQLHRQLGVWVAEDTGGKENPFAKDYDVKENDRVVQTSPRVNDKFECHGERGTEMITMVGSHHDDGLDIDRALPILDDEA